MQLRTLGYFLAVADAGSVTAAARAVHVTQPSLSRQLRQLEHDLGIDLFDRRDGRLSLSAAGRAFLPVARDLVAQAAAAREAAASIAAGRMQHLTIAAPGTTLTDVVAPFLATLRPDDPLPAVWEEVPSGVYDALPRGADLVIGTTPPPHGLGAIPLAELPVWASVRPDHRWAERDSVPLAELAGETLLLLTRDFHPRRALDQALSRAGVACSSVLEFGTPQVAQAVAAAGRGIAVVSDDPRFGLHPLEVVGRDGPVRITLYAAWQPQHHAAATIADVARRLSDFCVARYGPQVAPRGDRTVSADAAPSPG